VCVVRWGLCRCIAQGGGGGRGEGYGGGDRGAFPGTDGVPGSDATWPRRHRTGVAASGDAAAVAGAGRPPAVLTRAHVDRAQVERAHLDRTRVQVTGLTTTWLDFSGVLISDPIVSSILGEARVRTTRHSAAAGSSRSGVLVPYPPTGAQAPAGGPGHP